MSTLSETISDALARLGPAIADRLRDIVCELGSLNLGEVDRLSALATALAAVAANHHTRHKPVYLEAVRSWSLEISVGLAPPPVRLSAFSDEGAIEEGAEILIVGLDGMLDALAHEAATLQDRLVLELAMFARLLGQHDANAVHLTLMAVAETLADENFRPGLAILVPLGETVVPLDRDACLATVAARGVA